MRSFKRTKDFLNGDPECTGLSITHVFHRQKIIIEVDFYVWPPDQVIKSFSCSPLTCGSWHWRRAREVNMIKRTITDTTDRDLAE